MQKKSLFIFRRDLRLRDNSALIAAMDASREIIPVFVLDPALMTRWSGSTKRLSFLAGALAQLDKNICRYGGRLQIVEGQPEQILPRLLKETGSEAVYLNRDYTPFARRRDERLRRICMDNGIDFHSFSDQMLNEPEAGLKSDGTPYTVFTPYFRKAKLNQVIKPCEAPGFQFGSLNNNTRFEQTAIYQHLALFDAASLKRLDSLAGYEQTKELPAVHGTSRLSAHLRFGTVSVRDVYHAVMRRHDSGHGLIRQLYWRDFYFQIGYHFPHVFHSAFRSQYDQLEWNDNTTALSKWEQGETGFPIVDAGMRELAATGFMHNRVRMIVASFLIKNLHIHWQAGESYFARHLIDFDPAINNGNWQWAASTGCDAQPYFRVFNPWRQQKRFDPECEYIKTWVPELRSLNPSEIHRLEKGGDGYLTPIVDLRESCLESKERFARLKRSTAG